MTTFVPLIQHVLKGGWRRPWPRYREPASPWPILPFSQAMVTSTRPLLDCDRKLMVLIAPKSACTSSLIWYFSLTGQYEAARAYNNWPHRYRMEVYNHGPMIPRAIEEQLRGYRVVRIIRDPWSRAISSFRHALVTGYANAAIERLLGVAIDRYPRLSFSRFLDFLEASDLRSCNPHHAVQRHPIEDYVSPTWTINVSRENLMQSLNGIEQACGLPKTDFESLSWLHDLHERRDFRHRLDLADATETVLGRSEARHGPWPTDTSLLTPTTIARIGRLYRLDIDSYALAPPVSASPPASTS